MDVRYSYHKDPLDPRRILAVARRWQPGDKEATFALAICNPKDQFSKKRAHLMLLGRLDKREDVAIVDGEPPLAAVLRAIATTDWYPMCARRIAGASVRKPKA